MMSEESQIEELLDRWDDLHESGERLSFDEFVARYCADANAEILDALRNKIAAIESMNALLDRDQRLQEAAHETRSNADTEDTQDTQSTTIRLKPGTEPVPGYQLVSPLGEGGFGEVWKAVGPGGFHVALKFVRLDRKAAEPELRAIEITKNLRHPNLLSTFGTWQKDGWLIIASELAGKSLYDRFRSLVKQGTTGIPERELHSYMNDAAKAIDHLNKPHHLLGDGKRGSISHRDIKPQNLLLSGGGVKVADFGIARFLERHVTSHTGAMSVAYAAPEFFDGQTSNRSDQYSLAVTYCKLRGGRLPFEGTDIQMMRGHVEGIPDLSMLPGHERPVLLRALAKKPEDRWPNCRAFVKAVETSALSGATTQGTSPPPLPESERRKSRQKFVKTGAFIAMVVTVVIVLALWPDSNPAPSVVNSIGMQFKLLPGGTFTMGTDPSIQEGGEAHKVTLTKPFELGVYEVTQQQYEKVMGTNPSSFEGPQNLVPKVFGAGSEVVPTKRPQNPVGRVSWNDAVEFCRKLSSLPEEKAAGYVYRLPTEAEWEYACRAGTTTKYSFGNSDSELGDYAWYKNNSGGTTHPVGGKKPNGWGLYDMHGNVWEWCQDWHGVYPSGSTTDPTGAVSGSSRVTRGGSWLNDNSDGCLSAIRRRGTPGERYDFLGFRVVRSSIK